MSVRPKTNTGTPSTSTAWKTARIPKRPQGQTARGSKSGRWGRRSKVNPRDPLTLTVTFRGGAEAWYEIHARGEVGRFVGVTCLHDVVQEIAGGVDWYYRQAE